MTCPAFDKSTLGHNLQRMDPLRVKAGDLVAVCESALPSPQENGRQRSDSVARTQQYRILHINNHDIKRANGDIMIADTDRRRTRYSQRCELDSELHYRIPLAKILNSTGQVVSVWDAQATTPPLLHFSMELYEYLSAKSNTGSKRLCYKADLSKVRITVQFLHKDSLRYNIDLF